MRARRVLPAVLILLASVTACSSTIEGQALHPSSDVPVTEEGDTFSDPDDDGTDDEELEGLLLTLEDLPSGWTEGSARDGGPDTEDDLDRCIGEFEQPDFLDDARGGIDGEAETEFSGPDEISSLSQSLTRMEYAEDTALFLDGMSALFDRCSEGSFDVDGDEAAVTITPAPLDVGDDARSWVMAIELGVTFEVHFAVVAQDEYVMLMIFTDPIGGNARAALEDLAGLAVDRL